jgi:hypothetical protein
MSQEPTSPVWTRAVSIWHAVAFFAASIACYLYPDFLFGDAAFLGQALLPMFLLGCAMFAAGVLMTVAAVGRSRTVLRLALVTAFVFDIQAAMVLLLFTYQIDNADLLGGIPTLAGPLMTFAAFAIPAAAAVFMLRERIVSASASAATP